MILGVQVDAFARKLGYVVQLWASLIKLHVCSNFVHKFSQQFQ